MMKFMSFISGAVCIGLLSACSSMPDMNTGRRAAADGDYKTAVHHYEALSEFGLPEAKMEMARLHIDGKGVPQDSRKALALLKEAEEAGDTRFAARQIPKVQRQLGAQALKSQIPGVSPAEGIALLQAAADRGDSAALYQLGQAYEKGTSVAANPGRAAQYYKQAADAGYARANLSLARLYEKGRGVPANPSLARDLYMKAQSSGISVDADLQRLQKKSG